VGVKAVCLDTTYRLPSPILSAAQAILGEKRHLLSIKAGPKVEIVSCPTEDSEAEQLLVRIEKLVGGSSHFAVNSGRAGDAKEPDIGFGDVVAKRCSVQNGGRRRAARLSL
jgi:superfamily I DNA/RNA helicase